MSQMSNSTGVFSPEEIAAEKMATSDREISAGDLSGSLQEINIDPLPRENMVLEGAEEGGKVDSVRRRRILAVAAICLVALGVIMAIAFPVTKHKQQVAQAQAQANQADILLDESGLETELDSQWDSPSVTDEPDDTTTETESVNAVREDAMLRRLMELSGDAVLLKDTPQYEAAQWIIRKDGLQLSEDSSRLGQRYVMGLLYFSLDGQNWKNKTNFLSDKSECDWAGVTCDPGSEHIHKIIWRNNSMDGILPEEMGHLSHMEHLNMDDNALDGRIPRSIFTNMTKLKLLDLSGNVFSGQIPDEIGNLSNLKELDLNSNILNGPLNPQMAKLQELQVLKLYSNSLTGTLMSELGSLQKLKRLDLDDNRFDGTLPNELGYLQNMQVMWLNGNSRLGGTIPEGIFSNMTNLDKLFLGDMALEGTISNQVGNLQKLEFLQLKNNNLNGTIPESLGNCSQLLTLELDRNQLEGPLPKRLGDLTNLVILYLSTNTLGSSIPEEWGGMTNLTTLVASSANITGQLRPQMGNLARLQYLLLDRNQLTGPLPGAMGNLDKLSHLYLYDNQLTGQLPTNLGRLTNLQELVVDQNNFTGPVPSELGKLSKLTTMFLFENEFKGQMPQPICNLKDTGALKNLWADCQDGGFNCTCCTACCVFNNAYRGCFYVNN